MDISKDKIIEEQEELLLEASLAKREIEEMHERYNELEEMKYELDDSFIKINCPQCKATGMVKEQNKKTICPTCRGKKYIWAKKYKE